MALPVNPVFVTDAGDIFKEIGVDAIYTAPGGARAAVIVIFGRQSDVFAEVEDTTENNTFVAIQSAQVAPAKTGIIDLCTGERYKLIARGENNGIVTEWMVRGNG